MDDDEGFVSEAERGADFLPSVELPPCSDLCREGNKMENVSSKCGHKRGPDTKFKKSAETRQKEIGNQ